jgi:hypothetical protein
MLHWPDPSHLTPIARANLRRFHESGASAELEQDTHDWSFEMWSWRDEPDIHLTVRNELAEERVVSIDAAGKWEASASEVDPTLLNRAGM